MKIVYFDYWTAGVQNFVPLDAELRKLSYETILLHVGSFNGQYPMEEIVDGIKCRDITFYNTTLIYKMLEREKPDILITTDTTKLMDRVVTMSCRKLKIKSIYLMHGIRDLGESNDQLVALMEKSYNSLLKKLKKSGKYFKIVIPNYLYTLFKYKPINIVNFRFAKVVYSYFKNPGRAFYFPDYRDELINDKCLVYSANEGKYYEKLGYRAQDITIVGNPKCDKSNEMIINNKFKVDMLPDEVKALVETNKKYALYLEEGFPEQNNMGGYSAEIRDRFIMECAERLKKDNLKLVVKLHPVTQEKTINAKRHDNCIIERDHLDVLIYFSKFCICSMSTTINNAVLMNKPVLMPRWYASTNIPTFFVDVGVSDYWMSTDDELRLTINDDARKKYIEDYITVVTPDAVNNAIRAICD